MDPAAEFAEQLTVPGREVLVITGAGVSVASGIPTFRGPEPDAVWTKDVTELGTYAYFRKRPAEQWRWYLERFSACANARPNDAHVALAQIEHRLEATTGFLLVTQNIDGLHRAAGSTSLIEVHGSAHHVRCSKRGCPYGEPHGKMPLEPHIFDAFRANPVVEMLPRCARCNSLLRPHVLWFDELYNAHVDYGYKRVLKALQQFDVLLFVGTSFSVGITESALDAAQAANVPTWIVDPHITDAPIRSARLVSEPAEAFLPRVYRHLPPS